MKSLTSIGLTIGLLVSLPMAANASPALVGTTTDPTGINGLVVDNTIYDVTFSLTTLNTFTYRSALSIDAVNALANALNTLSVTELNNFSKLGLSQYALDVDNSTSPNDEAGCFGCAKAGEWLGETTGGDGSGLGLDTGGEEFLEAADFTAVGTVSAVPEPLTLSLFGAGLAGAIAMRRRKKKA